MMREEFVSLWNNVFDQRGQNVGRQYNVGGEDMPKGNATVKASKVWIDEKEGFSHSFMDLYPSAKLDWRGRDAGLPDVVAKLADGYNVVVPSTAMQKLAEAWDAYLDAAVDEAPEDEDILVSLLEGVSLIIAQLGALDTRVGEMDKDLSSMDETIGSLQNTLSRAIATPGGIAVAVPPPVADQDQEVEVYVVSLDGGHLRYEHAPMVRRGDTVNLETTLSEAEEKIVEELVRRGGTGSGTLFVTKAAMPWFLNVYQSKPLDQWIAMYLDG